MHLTERQQLALALQESRRAAAAAATRKGLSQPSDASTSGSDSESEVGAFRIAEQAAVPSTRRAAFFCDNVPQALRELLSFLACHSCGQTSHNLVEAANLMLFATARRTHTAARRARRGQAQRQHSAGGRPLSSQPSAAASRRPRPPSPTRQTRSTPWTARQPPA